MKKIFVFLTALLTLILQNVIAQIGLVGIDVTPGEIKWSNTNDTILNVCYDTELDSNLFIENKELPTFLNDGYIFNFKYLFTGEDNISYGYCYNEIVKIATKWLVINEQNTTIEALSYIIRDLRQAELGMDYIQQTGNLPPTIFNALINNLKPGIYKIKRQINPVEGYIKPEESNQLTLIIHDKKYIKPIDIIINEPIKCGDNIYLGYQKENTDSLYTFKWLINNEENLKLTEKNLYQINKEFKGELNIKLQAKTKFTGCIGTDSIKLNVKPQDTIFVKLTDTIYITKTDTVYITKTDTVYIEKTSEKTAINTKQINLNVWPNPTTTFVNAEAEEPFSYTLLNNEGKILKKEEGESSYTIDMSEYSDGVYFIKTSDGITHKIIKE